MSKGEQKIIERIQSIENDEHDEDTIKLLLIEIREKLKKETILKEICHFVAHTDREKGICHKKVDVRYAKLKFVGDNTKALLTEEFVQKNIDKPERFFTDTMLNYINTDKIEESIFKLIILSGIDDIRSDLFLKYYKLNCKQVKEFILKSYTLKNGYYEINTTLSIKQYILLDDILKFIRGTITGDPVFNQKEIATDFMNAIKKLCKELKYDINIEKINTQLDSIIISILALIHDATFKLFDGSIGVGYLSVHPKHDYQVICYMSNGGNCAMPLITTEINALDFIDVKSNDELEPYELKELPWNYCKRDQKGKLKLVKTKE